MPEPRYMRLLLTIPNDVTMSEVHDALLPLKLASPDVRMYINLDDIEHSPSEPSSPWMHMAFTVWACPQCGKHMTASDVECDSKQCFS